MSQFVEVYVPVCVTINTEDKTLDEATVDFEGAPWMFVLEEDNVWRENPDGEYVWSRDEELETTAIELLNERLRADE